MCTCAVALACCDAISSKVDAVADLKKQSDCAVKTFNISPERKSFTQTLSSFKKTMQKSSANASSLQTALAPLLFSSRYLRL